MTAASGDTAIDEILHAVTRWSVHPDDLAHAGVDRSGFVPAGLPAAVVYISNPTEVEMVLRLASRSGVPIVTRGAGSGLAGGATAGRGEIVLDLSGLDAITSIDPVNRLARVEPGVITVDLDRAAAEHGLSYAPDPASAEISTIGGNIATNAGGLRCVKYGVTRDAILELDVVLGDGRRLSTGHRSIKGVTGYDLTSLLVGSEGTLGIVVGATVRLVARETRTSTLTAGFTSVAAAVDAVVAILADGVKPAVMELLDRETLNAVQSAGYSTGLDAYEALLLVQTDGPASDRELAAVAEVACRFGGVVQVAADEQTVQSLLDIRRQALPSIERHGRVLIEDIAVPIGALAEAVQAIEEISRRTGVHIFTFAHAGDGNLHPIVLVGGDPAAPVPPHIEGVVGELFSMAVSLGGTLSGEHGIGTLKRKWLDAELSDVSRSVHHALKHVFDPAGILNPHKAI